MISNLIICFTLTLIIEYFIIKSIFVKKKIFTYVFLVNILTNPAVVFIYNIINIANKWILLASLELLVLIIEGYYYKHLLNLDWRKAFCVSFISNAIACAIGIFIR